MKKILLLASTPIASAVGLVLALALSLGAKAQNPIVQTWYTSDPAPMVAGDRLYVYTGHDEDNADFFWMYEWRAYSTSDMVNWTDHGTLLNLNSFTWADDRAWAAQCIERNGKYYWYICAHSKLTNGMAIGVAVADSPTGPFRDALGHPLYDDGSWDNIDPTVFIDENNGELQAWLFWGNPTIHYAKLNDDMLSFNGEVSIVNQTIEGFGSPNFRERQRDVHYEDCYTEGPWILRRDATTPIASAAGLATTPASSAAGLATTPASSAAGLATTPVASAAGLATTPVASAAGLATTPIASAAGLATTPVASAAGLATTPVASAAGLAKNAQPLYYLLYAAGGVPEHIAYSTAPSFEGPWTYRGIIMPLEDTKSFTNHCGVVDFKGHSYFFYHTGKLPGGGGFGRSAAVEEFTYNADGTFPTIHHTDEGVSPIGMLNPYQRVEAETMAFSHGVHSEANDQTGVFISDIQNGDYIKVREVDFGQQSPASFTAVAASALQGGRIEVHLDSLGGQQVALIEVPHTGGWEQWRTLNAPVQQPVTGKHDIFFAFTGYKGCKLFNFDWWIFNQ